MNLLLCDISIESLAEDGEDRIFHVHVVRHLDRFRFFDVDRMVGLDRCLSFVDNDHIIEEFCT